MDGFGPLIISLACFFVGGGLISTALYFRAEYDAASFVCTLVFGLLILAAGVFLFFKLALPELKNGIPLKKRLGRLLNEDQTGTADSSREERLISEFRKEYSDFFGSGQIEPNGPIQKSVTQIFWHILMLRKLQCLHLSSI